MRTNTYKTVSNFGCRKYSQQENPLSYCVDNTMGQNFLHGSDSLSIGQHSRPCQLFMSQYCADNWDSICEISSKNMATHLPNNAEGYIDSDVRFSGNLTAGDDLIRNTAKRKYLVKMHNAVKKYEPFNPHVADSPMITYWVSDNFSTSNRLVPEYSVEPEDIDEDKVMNKILDKPMIAMDVLINIYNNMKRKGTLSGLKDKRIGNFYNTHPYFTSKGGL